MINIQLIPLLLLSFCLAFNPALGFAAPPQEVYTDTAKFCEEEIRVGQAEKLWKLSEEKLQEILNSGNLPPFVSNASPWILIHYPDARMRKHVFWNIPQNSSGVPANNKELEQYFKFFHTENQDAISNRIARCADEECTKGKIKYLLSKNSGFSPKYEDVKTELLATCTLILPFEIGNCMKGYKTILDLSEGYRDYLFLGTLLEFLTDDMNKYNNAPVEGSIHLANRIFERIANHDVTGNIFDDTLQAFSKAGLNRKQSEELTWKFMAIISISGANTAQFIAAMTTYKTAPIAYAVHTVSMGIGVLNSLSRGTGHLYMFPQEVKGECDNGKYYHYWMSAFLAHKNRAELSEKVSKTTALFSDVGYQFSSSFGTDRDPPRAFFTGTFSNSNNRIRIDLALAGSAAQFGSRSTSENNTDLKLQKMFTDSEELTPLSEIEARTLYKDHRPRAFDRWMKIIAPLSSL